MKLGARMPGNIKGLHVHVIIAPSNYDDEVRVQEPLRIPLSVGLPLLQILMRIEE